METQNLKSRACLSSFIRYCVTHPELRFWQALKNWSGYQAILTGQYIEGVGLERQYDTYNWEGRRHDEES